MSAPRPSPQRPSAPTGLHDGLGRHLEYLRLSITDRCNFRCAYCLPNGCGAPGAEPPLTAAEIGRLVGGFAGLGLWKVRLTGGEPTVRADVVEIVERVAATPGIRRVGLTTNGYRLAKIAGELRRAGLGAVNVSVDSLDPARFTQITGHARLAPIVAGVEAALAAGIPSVKVNAVLLRGLTGGGELERFLDWTRELPVTVRFIELMKTGNDPAYFEAHHLPATEIQAVLQARGWEALPREAGDGPARIFGHPRHVGRVGLIAPYTHGFCESCNRLRVSSLGKLKLCLFGDADVSLRPWLASDLQRYELTQAIETAVGAKPAAHHLREGRTGNVSNLAVIGG